MISFSDLVQSSSVIPMTSIHELTPRVIALTEVDIMGRIGILSGEDQFYQSIDRHRSQSMLAAPETLEATARSIR